MESSQISNWRWKETLNVQTKNSGWEILSRLVVVVVKAPKGYFEQMSAWVSKLFPSVKSTFDRGQLISQQETFDYLLLHQDLSKLLESLINTFYSCLKLITSLSNTTCYLAIYKWPIPCPKIDC